MVPAKVADLAFDAAFLMAFARIAKLTRESPVRAKSDEPLRFLAAVSAEDLLYGSLQIVVSQGLKYTAKVSKRQFVGFEKRLLRRSKIRSMKCGSTMHATHRECLEFDNHSAQFRPAFIPINLCFPARTVALRNTGRQPCDSHLLLLAAYILANRRLGDGACRHFCPDPLPDPPCRVSLFSRHSLICRQNSINERHNRRQNRTLALRLFSFRRTRIIQRLTHHSPMHPILLSHPADGRTTKFVIPANLLK